MISDGKYETEPLYCHVTVSHFCQIITPSLENIPFFFCLLPFLCFLWQLTGNCGPWSRGTRQSSFGRHKDQEDSERSKYGSGIVHR